MNAVCTPPDISCSCSHVRAACPTPATGMAYSPMQQSSVHNLLRRCNRRQLAAARHGGAETMPLAIDVVVTHPSRSATCPPAHCEHGPDLYMLRMSEPQALEAPGAQRTAHSTQRTARRERAPVPASFSFCFHDRHTIMHAQLLCAWYVHKSLNKLSEGCEHWGGCVSRRASWTRVRSECGTGAHTSPRTDVRTSAPAVICTAQTSS